MAKMRKVKKDYQKTLGSKVPAIAKKKLLGRNDVE